MASRTAKRLLSELNDFESSHAASSSGLVDLAPISDSSLFEWQAIINGPQDSPYQDRTFALRITIPESYPSYPPTITFVEPVFHPNVHFKTGEICLDVLKAEWSPVWTLASACLAVQALLAAPEPSSPLNVDAANLLRIGDQVAFDALARLGPLAGNHNGSKASQRSWPPPLVLLPSQPSSARLAMAPAATPSSSTPVVPSSRVLHFKTHAHFRHRLILSLLSRRPVRIDSIRPSLDTPGLRPYEISFLRLIEKITQGSRVEISYTGTSVLFHPGTLSGGNFTHQCPLERSIGWFLEPLLAVAPFGKKPLQLILNGVTTDGRDASVDTIRTSGLPHLAMFLEDAEVEMRITKRGHPPLGGGEVVFSCPQVRAIKSGFDFTNLGRVSKIRGIAHSVRVSPQLANRLVASARSVLNRYIPDVYIYTDVYRGEDSGKSPGYALTLVSSSTSQVLHSAESSSCPPRKRPENWAPPSPEDLGIQAARELLQEIRRGGCVDRGWEWLVTLLLVLGGEDVGKCTIAGPFDAFFIEHLRDLKAFFGTTFKIKPVAADIPEDDEDEDGMEIEGAKKAPPPEQYTLSCVGTGYTNTARKTG